MKLIILTGASGSGKSSIARAISKRSENITCLSFDSIGVPPAEEMIAQYGSGEAWQKAMTQEWLKRIKEKYQSDKFVLFEGQSRISFIQSALKVNGIDGATVVLVDCNDEVRKRRLDDLRKQPDLANSQMMKWAQFLRDEAHAAKIKILETGDESVSRSVEKILKIFGAGG